MFHTRSGAATGSLSGRGSYYTLLRCLECAAFCRARPARTRRRRGTDRAGHAHPEHAVPLSQCVRPRRRPGPPARDPGTDIFPLLLLGVRCVHARLRVCSQTGRGQGMERVLNIISLSPSIQPSASYRQPAGRETGTSAHPSGWHAWQGTATLRRRACVRLAATRTRSRARAAATEAPVTCRPSYVLVVAPPTPRRAVGGARHRRHLGVAGSSWQPR